MDTRSVEAAASVFSLGAELVIEPPLVSVTDSLGLPGSGDAFRRPGVMEAFELVVTCSEGLTTLAVYGDLDLEAAPMLARSLASLPGDGGAPSFLVDLDHLSFVDAAGLRAFVPSIRRLAARGERLVVRRPSALTRSILEASGLAAGLSITT